MTRCQQFRRTATFPPTSCANTACEARFRCAAPQCRGPEDALPPDLPLPCSRTAQTGPNRNRKAPHKEPHPQAESPGAHARCLQERDTAQRRPLQSRLQSRCGQAREAESRPGLPVGLYPPRKCFPKTAALETPEECGWPHAAETDRLNLSSLSAAAAGVNAECRWSHSRKAAGVDTPVSGTAMTQGTEGKSASGDTSSPRPKPSTAPPIRKSGTSEPTSAATRSRSSALRVNPSSRSRPSRAAAALADPAPSPPWMGRRFSMWIVTAAAMPRTASVRSAVFHAVLRLSRGTRPSFEVSDMRLDSARAAVTVTRSWSAIV